MPTPINILATSGPRPAVSHTQGAFCGPTTWKRAMLFSNASIAVTLWRVPIGSFGPVTGMGPGTKAASGAVPPPCLPHVRPADRKRLHPAPAKQILLPGGGAIPGRLVTCSPVFGGPAGQSVQRPESNRLPPAGTGRTKSPIAAMAPSGRDEEAGTLAIRGPRGLWGGYGLPSPGVLSYDPGARGTCGEPPASRLLGPATRGPSLFGGRPDVPLRGDHAPAGDKHPAGAVPPAIHAGFPDRGRDSDCPRTFGALVRGGTAGDCCRASGGPGGLGGGPRLGAQPLKDARYVSELPAPVTLG